MSELFRKVLCSERLPEKTGNYICHIEVDGGDGCKYWPVAYVSFNQLLEDWIYPTANGTPGVVVDWMEEVKEPTDEEIEKMAKKKWGTITGRFAFRQGYKQAIEDLKGGKNGLHR